MWETEIIFSRGRTMFLIWNVRFYTPLGQNVVRFLVSITVFEISSTKSHAAHRWTVDRAGCAPGRNGWSGMEGGRGGGWAAGVESSSQLRYFHPDSNGCHVVSEFAVWERVQRVAIWNVIRTYLTCQRGFIDTCLTGKEHCTYKVHVGIHICR